MDGKRSNGVYLAFTECSDPSREDEFNDWYTNIHLSEIVGTGLFHRAWRYQAATPNTSSYLAIYETDAEDVADASARYEEARRAWVDSGRFHPTLQIVHRSFMKSLEPGLFVFDPPTPGKITGVLVMGSNPKTPGTDDAYNAWYDNVHMKDIGATGLFKMAHRYEALAPQEGQAQYVNLYETELADVSRALTGLDDFRQGWMDRGTYYHDRVFILRGAYRLIAKYPA